MGPGQAGRSWRYESYGLPGGPGGPAPHGWWWGRPREDGSLWGQSRPAGTRPSFQRVRPQCHGQRAEERRHRGGRSANYHPGDWAAGTTPEGRRNRWGRRGGSTSISSHALTPTPIQRVHMTPLEITNLLIGSASLLIGGINPAFSLQILFYAFRQPRALVVRPLRGPTTTEKARD